MICNTKAHRRTIYFCPSYFKKIRLLFVYRLTKGSPSWPYESCIFHLNGICVKQPFVKKLFTRGKPAQLTIRPCFPSHYRDRVCDGEHIRTLRRAEGLAADTSAEGERHALRHLPLLHRRKRQQPPGPPERVHQGEQQSHGDACLERVRSSLALLGPGWAGHQHLLAQLLPGETKTGPVKLPFFWGISKRNRPLIVNSLSSWSEVIKVLSVAGTRQNYYLKSSKQWHKSPFKTPRTIDFCGCLRIHGDLFSLPSIWATSPFPILKTHFHLPMHMAAGWGKVISHLPAY